MASNLTEADIPRAALGNRDPEALKVAELKFWLHCMVMTFHNSFISLFNHGDQPVVV